MARLLIDSPPEDMLKAGDKKLIPIFQHAAGNVPFYRKLLKNQGIDFHAIDSVDKFKAMVPILVKEMMFPENRISELCVGGSMDDVCLVYSSSGSSKVFSFGVETWNNREASALGLEFLLNNAFQIFENKTFLINCLPMGVKVFTRTLPVAETSVRDDVVLGLIMKLKEEYDQFILVGESPFLKKVVEEGVKSGVPWKDIQVNCITGGEYIPETYRKYMEGLLGIDPDDPETGQFAVNMGLSELSLSIFCENYDTVKIRRTAAKDEKFRSKLTGDDLKYPPLIMQYFPQQTWLETIPDDKGRLELVVTLLNDKLKIPMIRYNTCDRVELMSYRDMEKILKESGNAHLLPRYKLPFGIIYGKKLSVIDGEGKEITVNEVKEALYDDFETAGMLTGNFKLLSGDNHAVKLLVQLNPEAQDDGVLKKSLTRALKKYSQAKVGIEMVQYGRFPYGMEHNFEKKNQYV